MGLHAVPSVVLRGHHADVQALDFDQTEGVLISGRVPLNALLYLEAGI